MRHAAVVNFPDPDPLHRLDSWKEIASHLRRTVRTVQRWERLCGLPVRRHEHARGASVYAFAREIDQWWADRTPLPAANRTTSAGRSVASSPIRLEHSARLHGFTLRVQVDVTSRPGTPLHVDDQRLEEALASTGRAATHWLRQLIERAVRADDRPRQPFS
jgi:hypothetical protein